MKIYLRYDYLTKWDIILIASITKVGQQTMYSQEYLKNFTEK